MARFCRADGPFGRIVPTIVLASAATSASRRASNKVYFLSCGDVVEVRRLWLYILARKTLLQPMVSLQKAENFRLVAICEMIIIMIDKPFHGFLLRVWVVLTKFVLRSQKWGHIFIDSRVYPQQSKGGRMLVHLEYTMFITPQGDLDSAAAHSTALQGCNHGHEENRWILSGLEACRFER